MERSVDEQAAEPGAFGGDEAGLEGSDSYIVEKRIPQGRPLEHGAEAVACEPPEPRVLEPLVVQC